MTTATLVTHGNRTMETDGGTASGAALEELVDRLIDCAGVRGRVRRRRSPARRARIHEARQAPAGGGRGHGTGGAGRRGPDEGGTTREVRWAFSEWSQSRQAAFRRRGRCALQLRARDGLPPWSPGATAECWRWSAALGMRWRPGKLVSERSLRGLQAPERRRVMVAQSASTSRRLRPVTPWATLWRLQASVSVEGAGSARASAPSTTKLKGSFTVY